MVQTATSLNAALDALAAIEPAFGVALERAGYPPPRVRDRGYATLLRTIIGQQVSVAAAQSIWNKLEAQVGDLTDPATVVGASDEQLRAAGLSRQKVSYARSLAEEVTSGRLDFDRLPEDDEEAIAQLVRIKGIGRWSAEIYLPAGDLAVQIEIGRILGHDELPAEKLMRDLAEAWRPHRGAAAILAWHHYKVDMEVI